MTATSAGSALVAKGLDISLAALKRQDPYINTIVDVASQVALYTYNNKANEWEKTEVEGTLFIYSRLASPRHGFTIMNRLSIENLTEPITKDLDFQLQDPFLLYRNARLVIHGIWFYDREDCQRIAQRMKFLTHQEQVQAQSQGGWLSPGGNQGKPVDIIQMLSKAHNEYDKEKSSSEPKEIGGSSVLYGNTNLIKPIPVKPNTQENEGRLSLATLFGTQHKPPTSQPAPAPSFSSSKTSRPHIVRTLTYDNTTRSGQSNDSGEQAGLEKGRGDGGMLQQQQPDQPQPCVAIQKLMQAQRSALQTVSESPENRPCNNGHQFKQQLVSHPQQQVSHPQQQVSHPQQQVSHAQQQVSHPQQQVSHHQQQVSHPQQQVSHPQQQVSHHQQQVSHHIHHQQQVHQLMQADAFQRLFQSQPHMIVPPQCCSAPHHPPAPVPPAPVCHQHQNQPLVFNRTREELQQPVPVPPPPVTAALLYHQNQPLVFHRTRGELQQPVPVPSAPVPATSLCHQHQVFNRTRGELQQPAPVPLTPVPAAPLCHQHQVFTRTQGELQHNHVAAQSTGVLSPHELLQKLQIVQQEQSRTSPDPPQPHPQDPAPLSHQASTTLGQKAALQLQVISPQRIPATVAPPMLLSPSVFTQTKAGPASAQAPGPAPPHPVPILSRSHLQATLLHLIQNDSSFLDSIYEAYSSRFSTDSCKY